MAGLPRQAYSIRLKKLYDYLAGHTTFDDGDVPLGAIPSVTGLTVAEEGVGIVRRTVLNFSSVAFALTDVASTVAYSGKKVYDFPAGNILVLGATADLSITKTSAGVNDNWDGDASVGTVTASNNATLSSTEQDIIPTTPTPQATGVGAAAVTTFKAVNAAAIAPLDGTATAIDLFLNLLVDDDDQDVTSTPASLVVNGTLVVTWINLGDK